jgi:hypothetical protein
LRATARNGFAFSISGRQALNSGIHTPLGQDRPPVKPARRWLTMGRFLSFVAVAGIASLSAYGFLRPEKLEKPLAPEVASIKDQPAIIEDGAEADPGSAAQDKLRRTRPTDVANVEKTVMEDGSVVTKFTPRDRDGKGPLIIDAKASDPQDRKSAAFPDPALIEDGEYGKLPIIAADGTRPVDRYARPWSGAQIGRAHV